MGNTMYRASAYILVIKDENFNDFNALVEFLYSGTVNLQAFDTCYKFAHKLVDLHDLAIRQHFPRFRIWVDEKIKNMHQLPREPQVFFQVAYRLYQSPSGRLDTFRKWFKVKAMIALDPSNKTSPQLLKDILFRGGDMAVDIFDAQRELALKLHQSTISFVHQVLQLTISIRTFIHIWW